MVADTFDIEIGKRLRQARLKAGVTQKQMADCINLSPQAYQKYETAVSRLTLATFAKLRAVLDIDLDDMLPTSRADGTAINSPTAAIGASITGLRLATVFATLSTEQQRAILDVALAMSPSTKVTA